jgi:amino acid adenylation domain-containing protein
VNAALLHHHFEVAVRRLPDKTALVDGDERVTFGELHQRVHTLAAALRADGVRPGDRVLVFLESSVEFAVSVHAVLALGGVFVPIGASTKTEKLAFIAADTRATALLTHAVLSEAWVPLLNRAPSLLVCRVAGRAEETVSHARVRAWADGFADDALPLETPRIDQDIAALIYTSGTTGVPKGVMLTHLNMRSAWASVQAYLGLVQDDIIGLALPTAFSYGLYNLLMGLGTGATVVLMRSAAFPVKLVQALERERVTVFPAVPTLIASVLQLQDLARFDLGALRVVTNAAAALPEPHLAKLRSALPLTRIFCMYGMTECMRISFLPPDELDRRPGSVGRGMPNQEHWLIDEDGRRVPNGGTGELVVRGTHVSAGYWERPSETEVRVRPGEFAGQRVLHTGDVFRTDREGYLYFVARKDDIIKTRGEKVAPIEVENVIYQLDGIAGCAVVGVADEALGYAIKAYVTLRPGSALVARDVIKHCLCFLENYMAPKFVEFVDELPRTESGKIRHQSLR